MSTRTAKRKVADSYFDLVRRFPLRVIRTNADHRAALDIIGRLMRKGEDRLDEGEMLYLEALSAFVAAFEHPALSKLASRAKPLDVLKHLMEEREMTVGELGKIVGSQSAASMILRGDREMSKAHIRQLAAYFNVSAALFI